MLVHLNFRTSQDLKL